jgi:hypothetical protein
MMRIESNGLDKGLRGEDKGAVWEDKHLGEGYTLDGECEADWRLGRS